MEEMWNRTNFKRLGSRVRVQIIWETIIFVIVVPVGLSSYVFGRRCRLAKSITVLESIKKFPFQT
jgi:hypothetical protein